MDRREPPKTVLVVEDDRDIREALCELIEAEGFETCQAADGKEAIACLQSAPPCLILLDLMMPVMSGVEVLEWMRANPAYATSPVVIVSAAQFAGKVAAAHPGLVRGRMGKPVDLARLLDAVRQVCLA